MQNRLDRDRQDRKKLTRIAKQLRERRRSETGSWLKEFRPQLQRLASQYRLRMKKTSGRFILSDQCGDVVTIWWSHKVSASWHCEGVEQDLIDAVIELISSCTKAKF